MKFIAEIGINHNGSLAIAKELIRLAKDTGMDIVKFQKRTPDLCVPDEMRNTLKYDTPWGDITYMQYRKNMEFWEEEYNEIDSFCRKIGICWSASAWDIESQKFLQQYNLKYNKIASPLLNNVELLEIVAKERKYTFISTGMSTLEEIDIAVDIFKNENCPFELMHCNSSYPMAPEEANLKCINTFKERYRCKVGYSGHEAGLGISIAAATVGIDSLERHITLDHNMWGSDQLVSVGRVGLLRLVRDVKVVQMAMGDGIKKVYESELVKRKQLRGY